MKIAITAAIAAISFVSVTSASAAGLKPGLYTSGGIQEICLQAGGTWYSPTFANWGGYWEVTGKTTHIWGNYSSGAGNDSIVVKGKTGSWTEWTDDLSYNYVGDPNSFVKSGTCTAAEVHPAIVHKANPSQR